MSFVDSYPIELATARISTKKIVKSVRNITGTLVQRLANGLLKFRTLGLDGKVWDSSKAVPYPFSDQQLFKDSKVPSILARNPNLRGIGDSHYSKQEQVIPKLTNPKRIGKRRNKAI